MLSIPGLNKFHTVNLNKDYYCIVKENNGYFDRFFIANPQQEFSEFGFVTHAPTPRITIKYHKWLFSTFMNWYKLTGLAEINYDYNIIYLGAARSGEDNSKYIKFNSGGIVEIPFILGRTYNILPKRGTADDVSFSIGLSYWKNLSSYESSNVFYQKDYIWGMIHLRANIAMLRVVHFGLYLNYNFLLNQNNVAKMYLGTIDLGFSFLLLRKKNSSYRIKIYDDDK